jgi:hypothetical protein
MRSAERPEGVALEEDCRRCGKAPCLTQSLQAHTPAATILGYTKNSWNHDSGRRVDSYTTHAIDREREVKGW